MKKDQSFYPSALSPDVRQSYVRPCIRVFEVDMQSQLLGTSTEQAAPAKPTVTDWGNETDMGSQTVPEEDQ